MTNQDKNKIYIVLAVLIVLILGWWLFFRGGSEVTDIPVTGEEPVAGQDVTVVGEITCLPYHINVAGQGCVKGVKGVDGRVYALNSAKGLENAFGEGADVYATGTYEPANTSFDDSSVFKYDGVLTLKKLEPR